MLGAMAGWVGCLAAMQAIRVLLAGADETGAMGDPQWGRLHVLDGLGPGMRMLAIAKDPGCRACGPAGARSG